MMQEMEQMSVIYGIVEREQEIKAEFKECNPRNGYME